VDNDPNYENEKSIILATKIVKDDWSKYGGNSWSPLYKSEQHDQLLTWSDLPVGATYLCDYGDMANNSDCLVVMCPNGTDGRGSWYVDSRASNCTKPEDKVHHCWVRHGCPKDCKITVDKNGNTCGAGAGSIIIGGWHGFLRNGLLVVV
jgi:hypothetical protein